MGNNGDGLLLKLCTHSNCDVLLLNANFIYYCTYDIHLMIFHISILREAPCAHHHKAAKNPTMLQQRKFKIKYYRAKFIYSS